MKSNRTMAAIGYGLCVHWRLHLRVSRRYPLPSEPGRVCDRSPPRQNAFTRSTVRLRVGSFPTTGLLSRGSRVRVAAGAPFSARFRELPTRVFECGRFLRQLFGWNYGSDRSLTVHQNYPAPSSGNHFTAGGAHGMVVVVYERPTAPAPPDGVVSARVRQAARRGRATYRTWDSGRRHPPRAVVYRARRLKETDGGKASPLRGARGRISDTQFGHCGRRRRMAASRRRSAHGWRSASVSPSPVVKPLNGSSASIIGKRLNGIDHQGRRLVSCLPITTASFAS